MAGSYNYDSAGYSLFFLLTFILLPLIPYTYSTFKPSSREDSTPPPSKAWNVKVAAVRNSKVGKKENGPSQKRIALIAVGWLICGWAAWKIKDFQPEGIVYDPFAILGISTGLDEKAIKKHYRRLSIKFHPDKVDLEALNQTKEEAESHFTELTKAYKSLTDEEIRKNYELYGHPDGKQEFSMGIALPVWIVEGSNRGWVMGAYILGIGILLPWAVGSWWYGSSKRTKDGVLVSSVGTFFQGMTDKTTLQELIAILSEADEFKTLYEKSGASEKSLKAVEEEVKKRLASVGERLEGDAFKVKTTKRAAVEIYARMLRVETDDPELQEEITRTVALAHHLSTALLHIALAYMWLPQYNLIISLQTFLIQALHPTYSSVLMQLPHVTKDVQEKWKAAGILKPGMGMEEWLEELEKKEQVKKEDGESEMVLNDQELREAKEVAGSWQDLELVSANFKVTGEKIVTPSSWVHLVLKVRLSNPSKRLALKREGVNPSLKAKEAGEHEEALKGEEAELEELLGRKKKWGADGEAVMPDAHTPWFPKNRKAGWHVFIGDRKNNKIFVPPSQVLTEVGPDRIRTFKIQFQAPPQPSAYFFRLFVKSDTYVDADLFYDMQLIVLPHEVLAAEDQGKEDEISDPEEDSLEGQMALMKGKKVKPAGSGAKESEDEDDESDEDDGEGESSSEEEDDDDSSSSDDSD
ncbi:hypothetical protein BT69DRAFT_1328394 [Atractiella rhizophila]|nr:hypothetical protein BT69DRAFT_1328394 [Atractiella rhizophila]